jgi:DNA polymerase I-like protein with 3'-5' exonuclease and polymerase domains
LLKAKAEELGIDPKAEMYKLPAEFVGEYAEADARLTWRLHERLISEIEKEDLFKVYDVECRLIRVIFNMTKRGVRVDMDRALALKKKLLVKEKS